MTKKLTKTYDQFDIVLVPFPFIESEKSKKRPAVILSQSDAFNTEQGASVMAMVTSKTHSPWPSDVIISGLKSAGLPVPSIIRMKLFTLDHRLILKQLGTLNTKDRAILKNKLKHLFYL